MHPINSDEEEEDGYDSPHARRRGASVDEFLRGSELGRQVLHREPNKLCSANPCVSWKSIFIYGVTDKIKSV